MPKKKIFTKKLERIQIKKYFWLPLLLFALLIIYVNILDLFKEPIPYFEDTPLGQKTKVKVLQEPIKQNNEKTPKQNLNEEPSNTLTKPDKNNKTSTIEDEREKLFTNSDLDVVFGNLNAPVTIIGYSSFTCRHCIKMHNAIMDKLKKEYIDTNKVKFIHRAIVNKRTIFSRVLQKCVDQKYIYNLTKDLFNTSGEWAYSENMLDQLKILSSKYEMSEEDFNACIEDKKLGQSLIDEQIINSKILKIDSVPVLFINKERLDGERNYEEIKKIINKKLKEVGYD